MREESCQRAFINASTDTAHLQRSDGQVNVSTDEFGSFRSSRNYNGVIARDRLGVRLAQLRKEESFKQEPACDHEERYFVAGRYKPRFLHRAA